MPRGRKPRTISHMSSIQKGDIILNIERICPGIGKKTSHRSEMARKVTSSILKSREFKEWGLRNLTDLEL